MKIIALFLLIANVSQAQTALMPEIQKPIPHLDDHNVVQQTAEVDAAAPFNEKQIQDLAIKLSTQFDEALKPLKSQRPSCQNESELQKYLNALFTAGDFEKCGQVVRECGLKVQSPKILMQAGLCEAGHFQFSRAEGFFNQSVESRFASHPDYLEAIYQYASYSQYGHLENQTSQLLALIPNTSNHDKKLWKAVIQRAGLQDTGDITKNQADEFLAKKISETTGSLRGLLIAIQVRIQTRDYKYAAAIQNLIDNADQIIFPTHWYQAAYNAVYFGMDKQFAWARYIYQAFDKYSHKWMSFPTENNTYNYTQIYGQICSRQLLQKGSAPALEEIKTKMRTGQISVDQASTRLANLLQQYQNKADFLTTYAAILALQGQHKKAHELYWSAHKLCPYYNRANWGIVLEKRYFEYSSRPDYDKLNAVVDREMQKYEIPKSISTYILNWNSLSADIQKRVAFGARIWLPYMGQLEQDGKNTYIKYAYELLSEAPEMGGVKDVRIGGANYPNDNRLWDDVRGVGGFTVVADLAEVYQGVQGDYNLLGHEVAHQFQFLMESVYPSGVRCIEKQYAQSKIDQNFPDAYSAYNKEEHFAQGVTYYMVSEDSPARFGLNKSWVRKNNPAQFDFISTIENAKGDLKQVRCL